MKRWNISWWHLHHYRTWWIITICFAWQYNGWVAYDITMIFLTKIIIEICAKKLYFFAIQNHKRLLFVTMLDFDSFLCVFSFRNKLYVTNIYVITFLHRFRNGISFIFCIFWTFEKMEFFYWQKDFRDTPTTGNFVYTCKLFEVLSTVGTVLLRKFTACR